MHQAALHAVQAHTNLGEQYIMRPTSTYQQMVGCGNASQSRPNNDNLVRSASYVRPALNCTARKPQLPENSPCWHVVPMTCCRSSNVHTTVEEANLQSRLLKVCGLCLPVRGTD